jgi:hypothetical protein
MKYLELELKFIGTFKLDDTTFFVSSLHLEDIIKLMVCNLKTMDEIQGNKTFMYAHSS